MTGLDLEGSHQHGTGVPGAEPPPPASEFAPGVIDAAAWGMIGRSIVVMPMSAQFMEYFSAGAMTGQLDYQWAGHPHSEAGFVASLWDGASDVFAVVDKYSGRALGIIRVYGSNHFHGFCSVAIYLQDPEAGPRVAAAESLWHVLSHLFERYGYRKIYGDLSDSTYKHIGSALGIFEIEGRLVDHVKRGDVFEDKIIVAVHRESWRQLRDDVGLP